MQAAEISVTFCCGLVYGDFGLHAKTYFWIAFSMVGRTVYAMGRIGS